MFIKLAFALLSVMALTISAEIAVKPAPYPAAGWRPSKPFQLPNEEYPDIAFVQQQQQTQQQEQPQFSQTEISRERVEFAGQTPGNLLLAAHQPQNNYLPPENTEGLRDDDDSFQIRSPPKQARPQSFNKQTFFKPRPNIKTQQQNIPSSAQQQTFNTQSQLKEQNFRFRTQPQQQGAIRSQLQPKQHFRPQSAQAQEDSISPSPTQFQQYSPLLTGETINDFSQSSANAKPAQQYGAPDYDDSLGQINVLYPDPRSLDDPNYTALEAFNSAVKAYNRAQQSGPTTDLTEVAAEENSNSEYPEEKSAVYPFSPNFSRYQEGQYYILGPDNALQRVTFTTCQDNDEAKTNGFTAKLKYMPAGEIRDPIFKYNDRGQLVRILRK